MRRGRWDFRPFRGSGGVADHGHLVSLTAAEVAAIRAGQRVQARSTTALLHSHDVTFN
jgi:hypothetical protein